MILLSFTVANHRSIRDEVTVDLAKPTLRTLQPRQGESWAQQTYPIVGIFGANASGKSALLDALAYTIAAIRSSSTVWQELKAMYRVPFKLDDSSQNNPSLFELDFIHENRRYVYGFETDSSGILYEWLRDVPSTRWRTLIDRDTSTETLKLHPSLKSIGPIARRELVLSRALHLEHPVLAPIATDLTKSFDSLSVRDSHRERRLNSITDSLVDGKLSFSDITTILRAADIGVKDVSVQEDEIPARFREALRAFNNKLREGEKVEIDTADQVAASDVEELGDDEAAAVVRSLLFTHEGTGDNIPAFSVEEESAGTIAWLSVIVPIIETINTGGIFCIDEIDSSLHPHLLDLLLGLFNDPELNHTGAQLIFTSHDTYILSSLSEIELEPEQIWFTDKNWSGVTELTCLADFPRHKDANVARRYLQGRYGGTPRLAPTSLASLIMEKGYE